MGKGIGKGERGWSTEEKDQLISILDNDGFDEDFANLAAKFPSQSLDSLRRLLTHYEEKKGGIKRGRDVEHHHRKNAGMEVDLSEDLPLYFQLQSSLGTHPKPSQVEGIDYPAIYAHVASCIREEIPKKLHPATRAELS